MFYYEEFTDINKVIERGKQLKNWSRKKKDKLIGMKNQNWEFIEIMQ
ncbi:MAG: hypothetical protein ABFR62_03085 [Bacteroidota bacterium]